MDAERLTTIWINNEAAKVRGWMRRRKNRSLCVAAMCKIIGEELATKSTKRQRDKFLREVRRMVTE
jgi:hypothetical protein